MMPLLLVILFILFSIALLVVGWAIYVSTRGIVKLVGIAKGSPLPRSVAGSLSEARYYGRLITRSVQQYPPGPMRDRLTLTIRPVDEWLANLTKLEQGLRRLYGQRNLTRELRQTSFEIEGLRRRLLTADKREAAYLRQLLESKKLHLRALKELQIFQTQAELKIRKIASDLGATHAEILLIVARGDFNENRLHRLDENLQDHVSGMRDILAAMDELGYRGATS